MPVRFHLTAGAWHQLRRSGRAPETGRYQFRAELNAVSCSAAALVQTLVQGSRRRRAPKEGAIIILGFWRSGTTLLHELLCTDERFGYPTTYACLNPHHFIFTQARVLKQATGLIRRVQDQMTIGLHSPQEDEFALLSLGARSPYEGLLLPRKFGEAFALADPNDLAPEQAKHWRKRFAEFYGGVSLVSGGKPLVLKSPAHSYRVQTLRELLPDPRFIVIVRNPYEIFESMLRTYRALTGRYGFGPGLADDEVRNIALSERKRFEAKMIAGLNGVPAGRTAIVTYESLTRNPVAVIERLYRDLDLPSFEAARPKLTAELKKRSGYRQDAIRPDASWARRIAVEWSDIFQRYGYRREGTAE